MRILFLTNYYPPFEVGGYEQLCRDVAGGLSGRGHCINVLTSDRGASRSEELQEQGIHRLLRLQPRYDAAMSPAAQSFLTRRHTEGHNRRIFCAVDDEFQSEVVFVWNLEGLPCELALDAEARPGTGVAYWLAGHSPAEPDEFWRYWTQSPGKRTRLGFIKDAFGRMALAQMRREGKPVRPQMRHAAVVSEYMRRKGLAEKTLPEHTEVIYNGVETESFYRTVPSPESPSPTNLLLAGRVSPDKGSHIAVEAVRCLAEARRQRDFRLIIAGSGPAPYMEELHRMACSYGIENLVAFLGWIPREQMPQLMHACQLLLLPTICEEPFARVTLEAMAAGLAVVGTLTGGTGELLQDGQTGLACASGDSTGLAQQIGRLLDDPQLRHRLASEGQSIVLARFTLKRMVEQVENLLERAIQAEGKQIWERTSRA
jgi:glycogen synthase